MMPILLSDSNSLQSDELLKFLKASRSNKIALAEEVLLEMHKREPQYTIQKCLSAARSFPDQIIVLKGAPFVFSTPIKSAKDVRLRLVDRDQTRGFRIWYDEVTQGLLDDRLPMQQAKANEVIEAIRGQVTVIEPTFRKIKARFSAEELKGIRKNLPASSQTQARLIELMFEISQALFRVTGVPQKSLPKRRYDAFDFFIFRYSMCMTLLYIRWLQHGNLSPDPDKLVNHVIDIHVATLGTFFGGVMSADGMVRDIHQTARKLLRLSRQAYVG